MKMLVRICVAISCLTGTICISLAQPKIQLQADANGTVDAGAMAKTLEAYLPVFSADGPLYPVLMKSWKTYSAQRNEKTGEPAALDIPTGTMHSDDPLPLHNVQLPDPTRFFEYHRKALERSIVWLRKRERVPVDKAEKTLNGVVSAQWAVNDLPMSYMGFAPFMPADVARQERDALDTVLRTRHFKALGGPLPVAVRFLVEIRGALRPPEDPLEFEEPFFVEVEFDGEDDADAYDVAVKVGRERNIQVKVYPLAGDPTRFRSKVVILEREG